MGMRPTVAVGAAGRKPWACLVRVHDPTIDALERILDWADELEDSPFEFWVSVDTTDHGGLPARALRRAASARLRRELLVHEYDEEDMLAQYPLLAEVRPSLRGSLAWGFHVEAVNLWFRSLEKPYRLVWIFEDDVGVTGDLSRLLTQYCDVGVDLLVPTEPFVPDSCWPWRDMATRAFLDAIDGERLQVLEMAVRVSMRLLGTLHRWSARGLSAWSEMMWPSVARLEAGMTVDVMWPGHIGTPFRHNTVVARREYMRRKMECEGCLVHSLKFGLRARLMDDALTHGTGELGRDHRTVGDYYCEYAASQWRRWSSVLSLHCDGGLSNGWDRGKWHTCTPATGILLILEWERWPADVLQTTDDGQTWTGDILPCPPGNIAGFVVCRCAQAPPGAEERLSCSAEAPLDPVGIHTAIYGGYFDDGDEASGSRVEELRVHRGGLLTTASGLWGSWRSNGQDLSLMWQGSHRVEVVRTFDTGFSWFGAGLRMARRTGRTGESLDTMRRVQAEDSVHLLSQADATGLSIDGLWEQVHEKFGSGHVHAERHDGAWMYRRRTTWELAD